MFAKHPVEFTWPDLLATVRQQRRRFLATLVIVSLSATAYALVRPDNWEASQALLIRNEAANNLEGPGKFRHIDDMKVIQETILEIAKSHEVLTRALTDVGPPGQHAAAANWPTDKDIDKLRKWIKISPPKGAEFGKTEVLYLKVKDHDRQRAIALTTAICKELEGRIQEVLKDKARSMVEELVNSVRMAQENLVQASAGLSAMERRVGPDLGELRILLISPSGAGDLRQKVVFIEGEIRRLRTVARGNEELLKVLHTAADDPTQLIAAPNSLLESQPSLRGLKEGLVDAQLKSAQLLGGMTPEHPQARAAINAEAEIRRDIHNELQLAIRGVEADSRLTAGQIQMLEGQLSESNERLAKVAGLRTEYSNLVSQVEHCTKLYETAQTNLADARAKQSGARQASLITRIDAPDGGIKPLGPSRAVTVLIGLLGGAAAGLGVVFVTLPLPIAPARPRRPAHAAKVVAGRAGAVAATAELPIAGTCAAAPATAPSVANEPLDSLTLKQALLRVKQGSTSRY